MSLEDLPLKLTQQSNSTELLDESLGLDPESIIISLLCANGSQHTLIMAAAQDPPLDEIQWKSPPLAASMLGIHSNSVLFYFSHSPFFDPTSNNAVLVNQAMFNPNMHAVLASRESFEGRLGTMAGLEFMVAQEPADMAPGTGTGVWVIRKQMRRKRVGEEDEITVMATYFVVGDNIYMAPSVADVLASRTVSSGLLS